jgi:hypothetical protein
MEKIKAFLAKKNVEISAKRYGIDALGAMAQGLFCTLLIGTILDTLGKQFHIGLHTDQLGDINRQLGRRILCQQAVSQLSRPIHPCIHRQPPLR